MSSVTRLLLVPSMLVLACLPRRLRCPFLPRYERDEPAADGLLLDVPRCPADVVGQAVDLFLLDSGSAQMVFNDSSSDTLTGSAGSDWFFAGTADKVTDLSALDQAFLFGV